MDKYEYKGTWNECLGVFLFSQLIYKNKEIQEVSISDYSKFELSDIYINSYNRWLDDEDKDISKINDWVNVNKRDFNRFKQNFGDEFKPKVELWSDRKKSDYYKSKLQDSFEFENFIAKLIMSKYQLNLGQYLTPEGQYNLGENSLGIEIKNDTLIRKYGNVYIEYAEKSNPANKNYIDSGILKKDTTKYFLIGTQEQFWIFKKDRLIQIFKEEKELKGKGGKSSRGILFKKKPTSLGFVFPIKNISKDVISLDEMIKEIKTTRE